MSMNILRYEWQWDDLLNPTPFHLGRPVLEVLASLTEAAEQADGVEYEGQGGWPWKVGARRDRIAALSFRQAFFELLAPDLWDLPAAEFVAAVDRCLPRYPATGGGDRLHVVFRDGFVAIAIISRP